MVAQRAVPPITTYEGLVDATPWLAHGVGGDLHLNGSFSSPGGKLNFSRRLTAALWPISVSYERIGQLKPFPADRGAIVTLAIAVTAPALPVILTQMPLIVILEDLLKALH